MKRLLIFIAGVIAIGSLSAAPISGYPNTSTLQVGDLFLLERPGVTNYNISAAQLPGALQLGTAAFTDVSAYDAAGAATAATNGYPWGVFYDPVGTAQTVANTTSNAIRNGVNFTNLIHSSTVTVNSGGTVAATQNPDGSTNYAVTVNSGSVPSGLVTNNASANVVVINGAASVTIQSNSVILPAALAANTNAAISASNAVQAVLNNTLDGGTLAPSSGLHLFGVNSASNAIPVNLGTGLAYDSTTSNLNVTVTGGSVTALPATNIWPSSTNIVLIDPKLSRTWDVGFITNAYFRFTNIFDLTNFPNELVVNTHQDTNGTWRFLGVDVVGGLFKTNLGSAFGVTTNATAEDQILCRLDWTGTNLYAKIQTNLGPQTASTNSLASGGGGGGGAAWTLIDHGNAAASVNSGTATATLNTTGAKFLLIALDWSGGGPLTVADGNANTWTASANYTNNNPKVQFYFVTNATGKVGSGHTFSVSANAMKASFHVYAFAVSGGQPTLDAETAGARTTSWLGNTLSAGSLTPFSSTNLFFSAMAYDVSAPTVVTNNSNFTYTEPLGFASFGFMSGFKGHTNDSTAENPGWLQNTTGNNADADAAHISFYLK